MPKLYEGMFLVDNDLVREDWNRAKSTVTDLLEKHGATIKSVRRFAERRLAYPIKRKKRGTYLLTYFESSGSSFPELRRDLDLSEIVLRYLMLRAEAVPAEELELSEAEKSPEFVVPAPPMDDEPDPEEAVEEEEAPAAAEKPKAEGEGEAASDDAKADAPAEASAEPAAAATTSEPAAPEPATEASGTKEA